MRKFRIGLIGHGAFGRFCLRAYQGMPEIEVVALAGRDLKKTAEVAHQFNIASWTADYRLLLHRADIEAIAIFTPPHLHAQMAIEAARAGKAILCEKPLALSLGEANRIVNAVKRYRVPATINYVMRYDKIYEKVRILAEKRTFGSIKRLMFENYAVGDNLPPTHWIWEEKKSGGLLVEHGVHFFDIFSSIIGHKPTMAKSFTPQKNNTLAVVRYPNDVMATFYHLFDKPDKMERNYARIVFERGYAEITGWIPLELKVEGQDSKGRFKKASIDIKQSKEEYYRELVQEVMRDLVQQIDNPKHKARVTLEDGRDSLALALMAKNHPMF